MSAYEPTLYRGASHEITQPYPMCRLALTMKTRTWRSSNASIGTVRECRTRNPLSISGKALSFLRRTNNAMSAGMLPVMEVVFLLERTEAVQDKKLSFESVWGCPISGEAAPGVVTVTRKPTCGPSYVYKAAHS